MKKAVTFGEILLRLSPPGRERLLQSPEFQATFGGGEANVAMSLSAFGLESHFVTSLPDHALGDAALRALRAEGVHTEHIVRGGRRVGIYFAEGGSSQRPAQVLYDRSNSAITDLEPSSLVWPRIFQGASWFHVSGITPALGQRPSAATSDALVAAKNSGLTVSLDVNYRSKLWSKEEAQSTLVPLLKYVDIVFASEDDIKSVLGISRPKTDASGETGSTDSYRVVAERVAREFGIQMVAMTVREPLSSTESSWGGLLYEHGSSTLFESRRYPISVIDTIGAGDAFAAGLIYAVIAGRSAERALAFAVAAGALKQTIPGDYNRVTPAEVDHLVSERSTEVQR